MTNSPPLADLYRRLAGALEGFDWFLFGARAAIQYGSARADLVPVLERLIGAR